MRSGRPLENAAGSRLSSCARGAVLHRIESQHTISGSAESRVPLFLGDRLGRGAARRPSRLPWIHGLLGLMAVTALVAAARPSVAATADPERVATGAPAKVELPLAIARLWTDTHGTAAPLIAEGTQVLALEVPARRALIRWVRAGGRLYVTEGGIGPALSSLGIDEGVRGTPIDRAQRRPEQDRSTRNPGASPGPNVMSSEGSTMHRVGLGEVVACAPGADNAGDACRVIPGDDPQQPEILDAAGSLALSELPMPSALGRTTAIELALYGALLVLVLSLGRRLRFQGRLVAVMALSLSFAALILAESRTSLGRDHVSQTDVVVDTGTGPALVWSGLARVAGSRGISEIRSGSESWSLRSLGASLAFDLTPAGDADDAGPSAVLRSSRGSEDRFGWLADGGQGGIEAQLVRSEGRITGLVRNGTSRTWRRMRLLQHACEPIDLDDLAPWGAVLVDGPCRPDTSDSSVSRDELDDPGGELSTERIRLEDVAIAQTADALLAQDGWLLLAWSRDPWRPSRVRDLEVGRGWTLMIAALGRRT